MKSQSKIPINQDELMQPRWLVNLNPHTICVFPDKRFDGYLKNRAKKPIDEVEILPFSYIHLAHGYYIHSCPVAKANKLSYQLRECFDEDDLRDTLKTLKKGLQ